MKTHHTVLFDLHPKMDIDVPITRILSISVEAGHHGRISIRLLDSDSFLFNRNNKSDRKFSLKSDKEK